MRNIFALIVFILLTQFVVAQSISQSHFTKKDSTKNEILRTRKKAVHDMDRYNQTAKDLVKLQKTQLTHQSNIVRQAIDSPTIDNEINDAGKTIILATPSIPFAFGQVQKDNSGNWQVSPAVSVGASYSLVFGKGYKDAKTPSNPVQVVPYFIVGIYLNVGVSENTQTAGGSGAIGNLNIGGVLGIYKYINLLAAYDALNNKPVFGVGARLDIFSFAQGAGSIILNPKNF